MAYSRKNSETRTERTFRKIRHNRYWLLLFLWIAGTLPELVLHCATAKNWGNIMSPGLILAPLFALIPAMIVFTLSTAMPKKWVNRCISTVYSLLMLLLCGSQLVYFRIFGTFYSVYSMANGAGAFQFVNTIAEGILNTLPLLLVMALPTLVLLIFGKLLFSFKATKGWKHHALMVLLCVVLHFALVLSLPIFGGTGDTSAYGLYHNSSDAYAGINKLGLLTAFRLDLQRFFVGADTSGSIVLTEPSEGTQPSQTQPGETTVPVTIPEETEPPVETTTAPTEPPLNVMDIDFSALASSASNSSVAEVHNYFASRTPSHQNDKTGLFEGCNLILITAEAYSNLIIDPVRTPTLYKLTTEGYQFTNYYVPDWGVSTTDGEYAHLTGTIPKSGVWSFSKSSDNYMPLTMAQQLINQGYSAYAYHGHTYTYYNRNEYLTNLGYQYKGYGNGLNVKKQWPASDLEVVDVSTPEYVSDTPFTTYYMSISGHREFNFYGNMMCYKNRDKVTEEPYSDNVRAYIACQLELEYSLALLMERLEAAGVLDNTVIVLTADHYPNGLTSKEIGELLGHTPEGNFEIYKNGCIIWKQGMEPEVIDAPASHLDILPTLSNLFGLEFDSRLYMGRDVFSDADPLVMFCNRSWITDKAMYNADTGEVTSLTGEEISKDYIKSIKNEVNNRFTVSARILDYDYWRILFY